jgi:ABC-2 type transport system permease protein
LNYGIYLSNSFLPCAIQLMIFLITCYLLGQEIKYGTSVRTLRDAGGSVVKAVAARLLPTTVVWLVIMFAVVSLLYRWAGFPMNGSWGWLLLSEFLFVLAAQGFALFIFCVVPNLRLSLSMCALIGVLSFSLGAFSFPLESMYGSIGIFSYILPVRYNFLIYIDQALNGIDIYYSRYWFVAYFIFILLPLTMLWRLKRVMSRPVYIP